MVTLISTYSNGDTPTTSNDSPTATTTSSNKSDLHLGNVISKLIQIVLWTRLGTDSYYCKQAHQSPAIDSQCYLTDPLPSNIGASEWELVLRIVHKDILLERWTFRFSPLSTTNKHNEYNSPANIILLLQSVYSHTRFLPVESLLNQLVLRKTDLDFLATTTDTITPSLGCHSSFCNGSPTTVFDTADDFRPLATVATHSFSAVDCIGIEGQLFLQVVYDETIEKASFVSELAQRIMPYPALPLPPTQKTTCLTGVPASNEKSTMEPTSFYDQPTVPIATTISSNSYVGRRRLSRLSLSALNDASCGRVDENASEQPQYQQHDPKSHPSLLIPLSTSPIQYTHHGHTMAYSTSPSTNYQQQRRLSLPQHHHGLVGSYEESLLSGRMSTLQPSKPFWFHADIGVLGHSCVKPALRMPPHRSVVFPAYFYDGQENSNNYGVDDTPFPSMSSAATTASTTLSAPPYVGTIDLTVDSNGTPSKGYRIPPIGQLQLKIKNPHKSLVKLFLVRYNMCKMPRGTKTFLRQKSYAHLQPRSSSDQSPLKQEAMPATPTMAPSSSSSSVAPPPPSPSPKYIIHLQICRTEKGKYFLYGKIRVVFINRSLNPLESLVVVCDGPNEPVYSPHSSS